jgi:hypothetical protein
MLIKKNNGQNDRELNLNTRIKEVMDFLGVSDERTALKWCKLNSVYVFKIGKVKYVNRIEFELRIEQPFIQHLQEKFPESWKEMYLAYKGGDYIKIIEENYKERIVSKTKFVAPGKTGNSFLKSITNKRNLNG